MAGIITSGVLNKVEIGTRPNQVESLERLRWCEARRGEMRTQGCGGRIKKQHRAEPFKGIRFWNGSRDCQDLSVSPLGRRKLKISFRGGDGGSSDGGSGRYRDGRHVGVVKPFRRHSRGGVLGGISRDLRRTKDDLGRWCDGSLWGAKTGWKQASIERGFHNPGYNRH